MQEYKSKTCAVSIEATKAIFNVTTPLLTATWDAMQCERAPTLRKIKQGAAIGTWTASLTGATLAVMILTPGSVLSLFPTAYGMNVAFSMLGRAVGAGVGYWYALGRPNCPTRCRKEMISVAFYGLFGDTSRHITVCHSAPSISDLPLWGQNSIRPHPLLLPLFPLITRTQNVQLHYEYQLLYNKLLRHIRVALRNPFRTLYLHTLESVHKPIRP